MFYRSSIVINLRGAGELPPKYVLAFVILDTLECEWEHTCLSYARTTHSNTWLFWKMYRQTIGITMAKFVCNATAIHCCGADQRVGSKLVTQVVPQVDAGIKWSNCSGTEERFEPRIGSCGHWEWKLAGYPNFLGDVKECISVNSWARISWNEISIWTIGAEKFAQPLRCISAEGWSPDFLM